ncbi:LysR family transcriptional regulator [Amycolatopsis acidicola]|uniref:LysR family transcriptional regulator n=1 Tax=Amycolatopsis acidicola TaxID=2596893 RepID=UPI001FB6C2DE|nr:LysR family transcriptional regulator [Amycolatopsis acidicola]
MELRQLGYFVAVAEELSFTKASRRLRVVQSGVSTAIRALEKEVGAPLFERDSRHVRLTDAGLAMLPEARATLAAARSAHDAVRESRGELHGSIVLGTLLSTASIDVPALLGRFHREHPRVRIRMQHSPSGSAGQISTLLDGTTDLAFVAFPRRPPAGLISEALDEDALALVCAEDHPLTRARKVTPEQLNEAGFVDFPQGWGSRDMVDLAFERAGLDRVVPLEVPGYDSLSALVRDGHGVAFVPRSMARTLPGLTIVPVAMEPLRWTLSIAISATRPLSRAGHALLTAIRAAAPH